MILSIAFRVLGYGFGFLLTLTLAALYGAEAFGQFSKIQSALELSSVLVGFGYSVNLYRESFRTRENILNIKSWIQVIAVSMPIGVLVLWVTLNNFTIDIDWLLGVFLIISLVFSALLNQILAVQRGVGNVLYPSVDYAFRSVVFIIVFYFLGIYLGYSVFAGVVSGSLSVGLGFFFILRHSRCRVYYGPGINYKEDISFNRIFFSVINFLMKKGDLIIYGVILSNDGFAKYKIAFLFSESIYQFSQIGAMSFLTKCKSSKEFEALKLSELNHVHFSFVMSMLLLIFASCAGVLVHYSGLINYSYFDSFFYLLFYFSVKSFLSIYEQLYTLNTEESRLLSTSFGDLIFKIITVAVFFFYIDNFYSAYLVLGVYELAVWSYRYKNMPFWSCA